MDERSLRALEYDKILSQLSEYCYNKEAKELALNLRPSPDMEVIRPLQLALDEAVAMVLRNGRAPVSESVDVIPLLNRARIESVLSMEELLQIATLLRITRDLIAYYREDHRSGDETSSPKLDEIFSNLTPVSDLERSISKKIISPIEMADNASTTLAQIRQEMSRKTKLISQRLEGIVNSPNNEAYLQEKLVSIRNGHYVVPVKSQYKSKVPGSVIDRSSTGSTLFIEPLAVLEINNDLRELEIKEQQEIERILKALTAEVALNRIEIGYNYDSLIELDFLFAKADYALATGANPVTVTEEGPIELSKARHPLIDRDKVVASDIFLPEDVTTLVITGPNTGGKTVTLKTLGLLSAMAQSGLYITARDHSKTKIFSDIFADIGDEQSIEQNLSTFSSHLTNIVDILDNADSDALVLFDELGAGTDPVEGAALAVSILENLRNRGSLTAATTHYAEIKEYALTEDKVVNASVEFDIKTLKPTYRLLIGLPGKSNAFEIAQRLGLPEEIINQSRSRVSGRDRKLEETLAAAQNELIEARDKRNEAELLMRQATMLKDKAQKEKDTLDAKREEILTKANNEASKILSKTKRETDHIYREVQKIQREANASIDNKKLEKLRTDLKKEEKRIEESKKKATPKNYNKTYKIEDFKKGDRVYIKSLDREADVLSVDVKAKKVEITSGVIRMKLKPSDLVLVTKKKDNTKKVNVIKGSGKMDTKLDLRGRSADEAQRLTEDFIADAILLGQKKLEIITGVGTGQVRKAVHKYLNKCGLISSYRLGGPGEGGVGATIVEL